MRLFVWLWGERWDGEHYQHAEGDEIFWPQVGGLLESRKSDGEAHFLVIGEVHKDVNQEKDLPGLQINQAEA